MANGIYIKKFKGRNYFRNREFIDSIFFDMAMGDSFPLFDAETEEPFADGSSLGGQKAGEFVVRISLLQETVSLTGKKIREFLEPIEIDEDYFYLIIVKMGNEYFLGYAFQEEIDADLNLKSDGFYTDIWCRDILLMFRDRVKISPLSSMSFANGEILTFEEYMLRHFSGLLSNVVLLQLPSVSYLTRLKRYSLNVIGCWAYGDFWNFIIDKQKINRWEAFMQLAKGLGFNCRMKFSEGTEILNEPEFIFEIFWLEDLANETPTVISNAIEHKEIYKRIQAKYLFLQYRNLVIADVNYSNGIIFSRSEVFSSDADNANNQLYPCCLILFDNKILSYDEGSGALITVYRDDEFREIELTKYAYDFSSGGAIGKLFPPNEPTVQNCGMAYSKIFNATTGSIDRYDHKPIQRYAMTNYFRFLRSGGKGKEITVSLLGDNISNYTLWKPLQLSEGSRTANYYVSRFMEYNPKEQTIKLELTKL